VAKLSLGQNNFSVNFTPKKIPSWGLFPIIKISAFPRGIRKRTISEAEKILHKLGGLYAKCTIEAKLFEVLF
jgi:hypothetical protein